MFLLTQFNRTCCSPFITCSYLVDKQFFPIRQVETRDCSVVTLKSVISYITWELTERAVMLLQSHPRNVKPPTICPFVLSIIVFVFTRDRTSHENSTFRIHRPSVDNAKAIVSP
jgi:hypothetical protein